MTRPVIGITSYIERAAWGVWDKPAVLVPLAYTRCVAEAGGRPVVLPPSPGAADETLDALDGVVFSGGADIDPERYGGRRHPETTGLRPERDAAETELLEAALERDVAVLAVCRGMQLLNVCRGGDLVQHLPDNESSGDHKRAPGVFTRHNVEIEPGSRLAQVLGTRATVASHHHQALGRLGAGLDKVAWAPDGTVEGIEDTSKRFVIGVLWHPEETEDRALFRALVEYAHESQEGA